MELTYLGMVKHPDGVFHISVIVHNKKKERRYHYEVSSEYAYRKFLAFYRYGYYGKALNVLKKHNTKETE